MVGKILSLVAQVGDEVREDDTVVVMEAMKMEIEIVAPAAGRVAEIRVAPGDSVEPDTIVAIID
jgi:biotin carboxyl carrier protein